MTQEEHLLLSVREAADLLGVGRNTVYGLVDRGELRVVDIGVGRPRLRIRRDDLATLIEERTQDPIDPSVETVPRRPRRR